MSRQKVEPLPPSWLPATRSRPRAARSRGDEEVDAVFKKVWHLLDIMPAPERIPSLFRRLVRTLHISLISSLALPLLWVVIFIISFDYNVQGPPRFLYFLPLAVVAINILLLVSTRHALEKAGAYQLAGVTETWAVFMMLWLFPIWAFTPSVVASEFPALVAVFFMFISPFILLLLFLISKSKLAPWQALCDFDSDEAGPKVKWARRRPDNIIPEPKTSHTFVMVFCVLVILSAGFILHSEWDWPEKSPSHDYDTPVGQFTVTKRSDMTYGVQVVMVSQKADLKTFQFFLKDINLNTNINGEIANQKISGSVVGIESADSWDVKNPGITGDIADHADNVESETGNCVSGACPVVFYDNDRDDKLSVGDQFVVRGVAYDDRYEAGEGWLFEVRYESTGGIIGSKKLP